MASGPGRAACISIQPTHLHTHTHKRPAPHRRHTMATLCEYNFWGLHYRNNLVGVAHHGD